MMKNVDVHVEMKKRAARQCPRIGFFISFGIYSDSMTGHLIDRYWVSEGRAIKSVGVRIYMDFFFQQHISAIRVCRNRKSSNFHYNRFTYRSRIRMQ